MTSINKLSEVTGFSREAIRTRIKRFNLSENWNPKDIMELKPLDETHSAKISLEQARTELAQEETALKRLKREHLEGKLCDVELILAAEERLLSGIASIIRNSDIEEDRKIDIFTAIQDHGDNWKSKEIKATT